MNDPTAKMMNQAAPPPSQPMMNQILPQMMNPVQYQSQQQQQQQMMMNQQPNLAPQASSSQLMKRNYGMWAPPPPQIAQASMDQMKFQKHANPNLKAPLLGGFGSQQKAGLKSLGPRNNWKGKRVKDGRRNDNLNMVGGSSGLGLGVPGGGGGGGGGGGYQPPTLNELQHQNRVKARRFFPKKKYNPHYHTHYNNNNNGGPNMGKFAPRNTSSFLIRAKKSGGIAELVSPYPVTPAVLPTPMFSPSREVLVDMAKEEWGVDGYGSMKGLIRLRSPGREDEGEDDDEEEEGESSDSDVEDHVEVERRLDHDLSRFEMIYPSNAGGMDYNNLLENRVDDQDTHIAQLEEENLILKDRLFLMERELGDLRRRMQYLERHNHGGGEDIHEEVLENESDSETESRGESRPMGINHEEFVEENTEVHKDVKMGEEFEGDIQMSKGSDENVTKAKDETDIGKGQKAMILKGSENSTDASLDNSMELDSKTDTCNDENVTKNCDQTSELINEIPGDDDPSKFEIEMNKNEEKIVTQLGSAADAGLVMLSMGSEKKDEADNDAITKVEASDE